MPAVATGVIKLCETCGKQLVIKSRRDLTRKRFCSRSHSTRWQHANGKLAHPIGDESYRWGGSRRLDGRGYVLVYVGHGLGMGPYKAYRYEHRMVMEEILGRPLLPNERVRHINGVRNDNRPENLHLPSRVRSRAALKSGEEQAASTGLATLARSWPATSARYRVPKMTVWEKSRVCGVHERSARLATHL
jgi:hypothetical protein